MARPFNQSIVPTCVLVLLSLFIPLASWAEVSCDVPASLWLKPRSGQGVLQEPALKPCWAVISPQAKVTINYPAEETAMLNASELQNWLTALGIASSRIELIENKNATVAIRVTVVLGEEKHHGSP